MLFTRKKESISGLRSSPSLLKDYQEARQISSSLINKKITNCLSKDTIMAAGKRLGILKGNTLLFTTEGDIGPLMDYATFHCYANGKNAVDRYALTQSGQLSTKEKEILQALQQAEYVFLRVEEVLPHGGVVVDNFFHTKKELLIDQQLSKSCVSGVGLATTIVRFPEFIMTTGAAVPFNEVVEDLIAIFEGYFHKYGEFKSMAKTHQSLLIAEVLKLCFREGVMEKVAYV
jgi:hypothetical protein